MAGLAFARPEPGKNDWNTAANGLPRREAAELTGEQEGRLALLLKVGHVGAVQVNLRRTPIGGHFDLRQLAVAFEECDTAGNLKALEAIRYVRADHKTNMPVPYQRLHRPPSCFCWPCDKAFV